MEGFLDPGSGLCNLRKLMCHVAEERSVGNSGLCVQQQRGVQRMFAGSIRIRLRKHLVPEGQCRKNEKYRTTSLPMESSTVIKALK